MRYACATLPIALFHASNCKALVSPRSPPCSNAMNRRAPTTTITNEHKAVELDVLIGGTYSPAEELGTHSFISYMAGKLHLGPGHCLDRQLLQIVWKQVNDSSLQLNPHCRLCKNTMVDKTETTPKKLNQKLWFSLHFFSSIPKAQQELAWGTFCSLFLRAPVSHPVTRTDLDHLPQTRQTKV